MPKEKSLITSEARKLIEDVRNFCSSEKVVSLTIANHEQYEGAGLLIKELKIKKKQIEGKREEEVKPLYDAYKDAGQEFKPIIDLVDSKVQAIERAGREYRAIEEKRAAEKQKRLDDEADARRRALESQTGTNTEKAAAMRRAAAELREKAKTESDREEVERLINEANKYEYRAQQYDEKAEIKQQVAAQVVAPIAQAEIPKNTRGAFNVRVYHRARIKEFGAFAQWVVSNKQWGLISANEGALNKMAEAIKGASPIPGVEFYQV